jgi:hypothetical protein
LEVWSQEALGTLNQVFSRLSARRRYEVWFLRVGLADGSGAWWFRYLLMNPGRGGCGGVPQGMPVQVWATWFPAGGKARTFIQGFPLQELDISGRGQSPFHFRARDNGIEEDSCSGSIEVEGHAISWKLRYRSMFRMTLSDKGWIGFSRTPHSDAVYSGQIMLDGRSFAGDVLGFGVQGHNCGYRHRNCWTWTHAYFPRGSQPASTLEALVYEMPFGLTFRKGVLWHDGQKYLLRNLQEAGGSRETLQWNFRGASHDGLLVDAHIDGRGPSVHGLPYMKTDCSGSFEVKNNSLAAASLLISTGGKTVKLETATGAVLEMVS